MNNWKEHICEIINNKEMNILDIYFLLFSKCLKETSDPEKRFQYIIETVQEKEFLEEGESLYISECIIKDNTEKYMKELADYIRVLSERNYTVEEFYGILYRYVFNGDLYPKETAVQSYLLYLLVERIPGIPYYQTENLIKLSNEEYKEIVNQIRPQIQRAVAMLNRHFETKTEEVSQLYNISQTLALEKDRVVYWSVLMDIMKTISEEKLTL